MFYFGQKFFQFLFTGRGQGGVWVVLAVVLEMPEECWAICECEELPSPVFCGFGDAWDGANGSVELCADGGWEVVF